MKFTGFFTSCEGLRTERVERKKHSRSARVVEVTCGLITHSGIVHVSYESDFVTKSASTGKVDMDSWLKGHLLSRGVMR